MKWGKLLAGCWSAVACCRFALCISTGAACCAATRCGWMPGIPMFGSRNVSASKLALADIRRKRQQAAALQMRHSPTTDAD